MSFTKINNSSKDPYGAPVGGPGAIGNDREIYEDFKKQ